MIEAATSAGADILDFARGVQILRGANASAERLRRIGVQRVAAFRRCLDGDFQDADIAMFGPIDQILINGPGVDPRLGRTATPKPA